MGPIFSKSTDQIDTVFGHTLYRPENDFITGCSGNVRDGTFSCTANVTSLPCTSQQTGQSGEVTVDTLNAFAPDIRHPYEILLKPNPLDDHAVSLHFGKLSAISTQGTVLTNHEHVSILLQITDPTEPTSPSVGHGSFDAFEYDFTAALLSNSFFYTTDIPINYLTGSEHICAVNEIEPAYSYGKVTISDSNGELNGDYLGTIHTHDHDFYVDEAGTRIAHPRTSETPSPYASFYSDSAYLIVYDMVEAGWRMAYVSGSLTTDAWTASDGTDLEPYQEPFVITGWNTLGGETGQYPSGTAVNDADSWSADDYATIGHTIYRRRTGAS